MKSHQTNVKTWFNKRTKTLVQVFIIAVVFSLVFFGGTQDADANQVVQTNVTEGACQISANAAVANQRYSWTGNGQYSSNGLELGTCVYDDGIPRPDETGDGSDAGNTSTQNTQSPVNEMKAPGSCAGWRIAFCGVQDILHWLVYFVWQFFGLFLAFAGLFLDFSIKLSIESFSTFVKGMESIRLAWVVVRDVLTITFIFALLYAGIRMILGLGADKNILRGVIVAGLLINFSFFFTSVIIDVSNVLTVEIYKSVQKFGNDSNQQAGFQTGTASLSGISSALMQGLRPIAVSGVPNNAGQAMIETKLAGSQAIIRLIMGSIFLLIATFVLLYIALTLVLRVVILIVLLITSPISVMGGLFPQLAGLSKKWWGELTSQAVQAPVLMLSIFVTVVVVNHTSFQTSLNAVVPNIDPQTSLPAATVLVLFGGSIQNVFTFMIAIGLLITGIIISKSMASSAGSKVTGLAGGIAGSLALGGVSFLGRQTVGRYAANVAESSTLNAAASAGGARGLLAAQAIRAAKFAGNSSFDLRGIKAFAGNAGAGKAPKGYIDSQKDAVKRIEGYLKNVTGDPTEIEKATETEKARVAREELEKAQLDLTNKKISEADFATLKAKYTLAISNAEAALEQINERDQIAKRAAQTAWLPFSKRNKSIKEARELDTETEAGARRQVSKRATSLSVAQVANVRNIIEEVNKNGGIKKDQKKAVIERRIQELGADVEAYYRATQKLADIQEKQTVANKAAQEHAVSQMADSTNFFDGEARQEAANEYRKKLKQTKEEKLIKDIKELSEKSEEDGEKSPDTTGHGAAENNQQ